MSSEIPSKLVDDEALDPPTVRRPQKAERPQEASEDPAAVDVADQEDGGAGQARHRHIRDVPVHQVGLGGIAGPLDQDKVCPGGEALITLDDG